MPTPDVGGESRRRFPFAGTAWEWDPGTWKGANHGWSGTVMVGGWGAIPPMQSWGAARC